MRKELTAKYKIMETSAKTGKGIKEVFDEGVRMLLPPP